MRGLTREELRALRAQDYDLTEEQAETHVALVEQGREAYREEGEYGLFETTGQGVEALKLYDLIGERMLT